MAEEFLTIFVVIDHADQLKSGVIQSDIGDLGDVAGTVEDDISPDTIAPVWGNHLIQTAADLFAGFRVQVNGVLQVSDRKPGLLGDSLARDQVS